MEWFYPWGQKTIAFYISVRRCCVYGWRTEDTFPFTCGALGLPWCPQFVQAPLLSWPPTSQPTSWSFAPLTVTTTTLPWRLEVTLRVSMLESCCSLLSSTSCGRKPTSVPVWVLVSEEEKTAAGIDFHLNSLSLPWDTSDWLAWELHIPVSCFSCHRSSGSPTQRGRGFVPQHYLSTSLQLHCFISINLSFCSDSETPFHGDKVTAKQSNTVPGLHFKYCNALYWVLVPPLPSSWLIKLLIDTCLSYPVSKMGSRVFPCWLYRSRVQTSGSNR